MAHLASTVRVRPLAPSPAPPATPAPGRRSLFPGPLPRPLARRLRQAGRQRLGAQRRRAVNLLGRGDPYGHQSGSPPCRVLALMASVVLPAVERRQLTPFGLAAKLPPRQIATRPGPVPIPAIAATTDL